jgi:acyl carrier protein
LGGESLLAITILHKIQEVFGIELQLGTIFELQTIEALAEAIYNIYIGTIGDTINNIGVHS